MTDLENKIKEYAKEYYSGESSISDEEFDSLVDELKSINPESEVLTTGWGYSPSDSKKVDHKYGLTVGSLSKIKYPSTVDSKYRIISPKFDGLSVVSYYNHGHRILSVTRGNGKTGIDVTDKINKISPSTIDIKDFTGAIRGEVLISNKEWDTYFKNKDYSNQRNAASGLLNRDDITDDLSHMDYIVYKIIANEVDDRTSSSALYNKEMLDFLGFNTYIYTVDDTSPDNLKDLYEIWNLTFPCDGVVLTSDKLVREESRINFEEIAYKFLSESKIVEVKDVYYNLTRTGKYVPVVYFDPIELSGAQVRRCTAFNAAYIRDNGIGPGSVIEVTRSNEVIPYIIKVIKSVNPKYPEDQSAVWSGKDLIIKNYDGNDIYHYISTIAETEDAGCATYSSLSEIVSDHLVNFIENVKNPEFLEKVSKSFNGTFTQGLVKTVLTKLISEIDPVRFLVACNIRGVSWKIAESIIEEYPDFIDDIKNDNLNEDKLYKVEGVGYTLVNNITSRKDYIKSLAQISKIGQKNNSTGKEALKFKVMITGALSMKRSDFDKLLKDNGIEQGGNFKNGEVKYLITNNPDSTSSKMQNAIKYGVEIISEKDFTEKYLK